MTTLADIGGISVTDAPYNADPTGSADSTSAIQSAIDAAYTLNNMRFVLFPSGTYRITNQLNCFEIHRNPRDHGHLLYGSTAGSA